MTLLIALAVGFGPGARAADLAKGAQIFKRCTICHTVKAGEPNRIGPNLHGLFEREAGKAPGFNYTAGLKDAHFKWDDEKLDKWLTDPQAFSPGATMAFRLSNAAERADVIAYLHDATK
ncbi:MAG TPA: cytochrome c family protein [Alphaproteobacteria bacterium]|nr:cytochrome c family protein [Alphaproteobacteria bacterium]